MKREAAAQRRPAQSERKKRSSPVRQFSVFTAAWKGHFFRPSSLVPRVAGAKAIPDARRADGAPQQARTSPRSQAGEGPRRCPMRHAADEVQPNSRDKFRVPVQRGVRGQATRRPRRAAAAMHRATSALYDQGVLPFSKLNCSTCRRALCLCEDIELFLHF